MTVEGLAIIDDRVKAFQIDCDHVKGYLYLADSRRKARALEAQLTTMERDYGFVTELVKGADVQRPIQSPRYCAAAFERQSGHLHPLKYGPGLAPEITARIMPVGTYIIGTAPLAPNLCQRLIPSNASDCDNNFILDYFRFSADHRVLFGGRVSYTTRTPAHLQDILARRMGDVFPALREVPIDFVWGGFVDISMNRAPDFGRLGDNLYYLQGFSGHGVALTGLAGRVVAQAVAGQAERFDVFAKLQHRKFPGGPLLRRPSLVLGTLYHRLRDAL